MYLSSESYPEKVEDEHANKSYYCVVRLDICNVPKYSNPYLDEASAREIYSKEPFHLRGYYLENK